MLTACRWMQSGIAELIQQEYLWFHFITNAVVQEGANRHTRKCTCEQQGTKKEMQSISSNFQSCCSTAFGTPDIFFYKKYFFAEKGKLLLPSCFRIWNYVEFSGYNFPATIFHFWIIYNFLLQQASPTTLQGKLPLLKNV